MTKVQQSIPTVEQLVYDADGKAIQNIQTDAGDMNTLAERMKIQCATYGPGDSKLAHTDQEFVESKDYLDSIKVLTGVFEELEKLLTAKGT